ncbi:MAG TPA: sulfite exporter TauE/SafE family protein [Acidimicrobiia bacterium]
MSVAEALLLVVGGMASGFINTLAGGGSVVTIPILNELVGISTANGTNRIAILLANVGAVAGFHRGGKVPWAKVAPILPVTVAGAAVGSWTATLVSAEALRRVFALVLLMVALSVLAKPSRWMEERQSRLPTWVQSGIFLVIGFYGGFLQVGVGFMLLGALVLGAGLDLVSGNAAKVLVIAVYTPVTLVLFASAAQVDWAVGGVLAIGQVSGAYVASQLAIARGAAWIRWVLVGAAVVAAVRLAVFG